MLEIRQQILSRDKRGNEVFGLARIGSRVASPLSWRLTCRLSAESTGPRPRAARPMLASAATQRPKVRFRADSC